MRAISIGRNPSELDLLLREPLDHGELSSTPLPWWAARHQIQYRRFDQSLLCPLSYLFLHSFHLPSLGPWSWLFEDRVAPIHPESHRRVSNTRSKFPLPVINVTTPPTRHAMPGGKVRIERFDSPQAHRSRGLRNPVVERSTWRKMDGDRSMERRHACGQGTSFGRSTSRTPL